MRLATLVFGVYFASGLLLWWFHALPEAEKLGGRRQSGADEVRSAPPPDMAVAANSRWKAPLGLLVLDTSGSMKEWDKSFSQALAAEIFAYFFARLGPQECNPGQLEHAHLAVVMFPGKTRRSDAETLIWPGANGPAKPWLPVMAPGKQGGDAITSTLGMFTAQTTKWTGKPGAKDPRNGADTPHGSAASAADAVIDQYRTDFGKDSNVFVVYFTDEPAKANARNANLMHVEFKPMPNTRFEDGSDAYGLVTREPGTIVRYFVGKEESPFEMVSGFLKGLELNAKDVTQEFTKGYPLDAARQLQPLVISGGNWKTPPVLVSDKGQRIETRGWGETFYTMIDPASPELAGARSLSFEKGAGNNCKVTLFQRGMWSLSVEPHQQSLLEAAGPPRVRVAFSGPPPAHVELAPARLQVKGGAEIAKLELIAAAPGQWQAEISGLQKLRDGTNYEIRWTTPPGTELSYGFEVLREFDIRFIDTRNQKTGVRVDGGTFLPKAE